MSCDSTRNDYFHVKYVSMQYISIPYHLNSTRETYTLHSQVGYWETNRIHYNVVAVYEFLLFTCQFVTL